MSHNTIYFLRHGKTKVDANTPISQWLMHPTGAEQAQQLAETDVFKDIEIIITSTEQKAVDTAQPIAQKLGLEIQQVPELSELDRDKGGFMPAEEYEEMAQQALTNLHVPAGNWESAQHALDRFSAAVQKIDSTYTNKKILIVGHGYTINMYFAQLLGELDIVYDRLNTNDFGSWGIVENGKVVKDIAR